MTINNTDDTIVCVHAHVHMRFLSCGDYRKNTAAIVWTLDKYGRYSFKKDDKTVP